MARNTDIRSYMAKTFPLNTFEVQLNVVRGLLKTILEKKKGKNFSPEHGQSFNYDQLKEVVHIKPGNRITLMTAGITFTERSLVQFSEELKHLSISRPHGPLSFVTLYNVHNHFDVTDFMDANEIATLNGEIYSTIMKRWYNRHRDGAENPTTIRHRLKSVDAFIELVLSNFIFDEYNKRIGCSVVTNGETHNYYFTVPVGSRFVVGDNVPMGMEVLDATLLLAPEVNTWTKVVDEISSLTGSIPSYVHNALGDIINEMCCQAASNKEQMKISSVCFDYRIHAAYSRENENAPYMVGITLRSIFGKPEKKYTWLACYQLNRLVTDMNKTHADPKFKEYRQPRPRHLTPVIGLNAACDGSFADFVPNLSKVFSPYVGKTRIESDKTPNRYLTLIPLPRDINADPIYQVKVHDEDKNSINILYHSISEPEFSFVLTLHELISQPARDLDWEDVVTVSEPKKPWHKRLLSMFK